MVFPVAGSLSVPSFGDRYQQAVDEARAGVFGGVLSVPTPATINLGRGKGSWIDAGGRSFQLPVGGYTVDVADNLIDAAGADAGAAMVASTVYYLYCSGRDVATFPASLRASLTAPSWVDGVRVLGATGDPSRWRFVGWCYTDAAVQIYDDLTRRHICAAHNRVPVPLRVVPGYTDDNTRSFINLTSAVYAPINGGTGDSVSFLSSGEEAFIASAHAACVVATGDTHIGIALDSTTDPVVSAIINAGAVDLSVAASHAFSAPAVGALHTLSLLGETAGLLSRFLTDDPRYGATADPPLTYLSATIWR